MDPAAVSAGLHRQTKRKDRRDEEELETAEADEGLFISCPEYEGEDLAVTVIEATPTEISFSVAGAIDAEYPAFITLKTRRNDKNAEPVEVRHEVTLKPSPVIQ